MSTQKLPKEPPKLWVIFVAAGGRRSRFFTAYENRGELTVERTDTLRYFDLHESAVLGALKDRLVIEWSRDAINWAKSGAKASAFPVLEIADPQVVAFPGFDRVLVTHTELQDIIADSRYAPWRHSGGSGASRWSPFHQEANDSLKLVSVVRPWAPGTQVWRYQSCWIQS